MRILAWETSYVAGTVFNALGVITYLTHMTTLGDRDCSH